MRRFLSVLVLAALGAAGFAACEPGDDPGIYISDTKLDSLPTNTAAWNAVLSSANAFPGGQAQLVDQDSDHDVQALAQAFVGERLNDQARKNEVCNTVATVPNAPTDRILGLSRQLTSYAIAADVADCSVDKAGWRRVLDKVGEGHSGGNTVLTVADRSANNWGAMARAAAVATGALIEDDSVVVRVIGAYRAYTGQSPNSTLQFTDTNWHAGSPQAGINAPGASRDGHTLDGVIPEDQRRTGEYSWPPAKGNYPWGALTATAVTAEILDHIDPNIGAWASRSSAPVRAGRWLDGPDANPADGNDCPSTFLLNAHGAGIRTCTTAVAQDIGFTQWTHAS